MNLAPINIPPPELKQPAETHATAHIMEILGAILLVALVGWLVFLGRTPGTGPSVEGRNGGAGGTTEEQKEKLYSEMMELTPTVSSQSERNALSETMLRSASTTGRIPGTSAEAGPPIVTTPSEKKKIFIEMSQPAPAPQTSAPSTNAPAKLAPAAPAPAISPEERQKLIEAMQQKVK